MDRYVLEPKGPAHGSILKVSIPFCEVALCAHQAMSMVCKQNINEGSAKEKQRNFHLQAWQLDKKNLYSEAQILHSLKPICREGPQIGRVLRQKKIHFCEVADCAHQAMSSLC